MFICLCMWKSEDNFQVSVCSSHHMVPRDQTQVIRYLQGFIALAVLEPNWPQTNRGLSAFSSRVLGLKATIPGLHLPFETEFLIVLEHADLPLLTAQ